MLNGPHKYTKGRHQKKASIALVLKWVKQAWDEISEEMVVKSFKKCGISNALDGTEDDVLWEEEEEIEQGTVETEEEVVPAEYEDEVLVSGSMPYFTQ